MLIMIIFLVLSLLLIIATVIYINKKKSNANTNMSNKETKERRKNRKYLSNILEIKIKDNIICLGNRYSIILKLGNLDYNMLSESEQDSVENVLVQTSLSIDYPVQFFSTTEFIDTSKVISLIKQNNVNSIPLRNYQDALIKYLENLMENRTISVVKNYCIISFDGLYENAIDELIRKATSFKLNLLRAKIQCEILNEDELYNLIYRELNKNSSININLLKEGGKNLYVGKKQKAKAK